MKKDKKIGLITGAIILGFTMIIGTIIFFYNIKEVRLSVVCEDYDMNYYKCSIVSENLNEKYSIPAVTMCLKEDYKTPLDCFYKIVHMSNCKKGSEIIDNSNIKLMGGIYC